MICWKKRPFGCAEARHPFRVLDIDMTEEQFAAFGALCPVPPQPRPIH